MCDGQARASTVARLGGSSLVRKEVGLANSGHDGIALWAVGGPERVQIPSVSGGPAN